MTTADPVLARMRKAREWVFDIDDRRKVTLARPPELVLVEWGGRCNPERTKQSATAWSGFTEADLLGERVGSSDPLEFSPERFAAWADENVTELVKLVTAFQGRVQDHFLKRDADRKNSLAT